MALRYEGHIGIDAGTGYVHSVTATAANVHDLDQIANLVRDDAEVVYADAGYQGVDKRPDISGDQHLSIVEFRVATRKAEIAAMAEPDRQAESRKAGVRAKVEHPFLIVKRDFGSTKTLPRDGQEPEPVASAVRLGELADAGPCRRHDGVTAQRQPARNRPIGPGPGQERIDNSLQLAQA